MERFIKYSFLAAVLTGLFFLSGCSEQAHARKKQQMVQTWEKSAVQARLPIAHDLLDRNQFTEAKKIIGECLKAEPEHPEVNFLAARIHLAEGRNDMARLSFQKSLETDPQRDEAWFALGILHQDSSNYDQALVCYQRALELQPLKIEYILALEHLYIVSDRLEEAGRFLEEKRRILPYDPDLIVASADLAQRNGDSEGALRLYKEAVLKQGNNPQLLEALGTCYMGRQQWKQAADVFEKILHIQQSDQPPDHVLHWLAFCSLQAQRYGKALTYYDQLSVRRREDPQVWLEMGQAALGADVPDRARYCGEKALQLQPVWTDAEVVIGCSLYMKKNYTGAIPVFQKICQDPQWEAFGWWMAGRCYQQLGQDALARNAFERASHLRPESPMIQMFMDEAHQDGVRKSEKTL